MDLDKIAALFGVQVAETSELDPVWHGMYLHPERLILIQKGLDPWTYRSILAHELGHAFYRDEIHGDPRLEVRANQWAARLLISEDEYRAAEHLHGPHPGAIAHDLGVTPDVVTTWCDIYSRILTR